LAARPGVTVADEHLFEYLEQPRYFADPLHLNREGRNDFSAALARFILQRFF
jgi:lysophospholipase L1-like esterase